MLSNLNRFDTIYKSEIIQLPQFKIVYSNTKTEQNATLYENEETSPFHRKDDAVLTCVIEGKIDSYHQGIENSCHLKPQSCALVYGPQDNEHFICENQYIESIAIGINKKFFIDLLQNEDPWLHEIINKMEKNQPFSFSKNVYKLTPHMYAILRKIKETKYKDSFKVLYLQSLMNELLLLQFKEICSEEINLSKNNVNQVDLRKLKDIKAYIETNILEDFSLDSLARISGLNTFKLKTGFKEVYGSSVFEHIRSLRMQLASDMLLNGSNNVSEVAYILGYSHVQHFSTAFKKYYGKTPGQFKC
ncbi:AraC family transcriptional regulator [Chryseobacterium sp. CFS15]|uniref:helix-turn-helix domain-containing protein n=1 Tax=Chryseobacterium sp. CFS15 TaxID=2986946 RepID=UPI00280852F8|nr:AraC family transcriptional regulator [Chryseobacterium sp. CFS15]MDQ8141438.1 AraC family transcriptional regulator [Chryseobacterium sp. CFS15]